MALKIFRSLLLSAFLVLFISCSEEESSAEKENLPEPPAESLVDTYNYIVLKNDGTLYTIGNKTGKVTQTGRIPGIEFNTIFNSVTSAGSKIFIYEHRFDPPAGTLYSYDSQSGKTVSAVLDFPEEFGENTALMSLDWDEENENLLGITQEDLESTTSFKPIKVVKINPESFAVATASEVDLHALGYSNVMSTSLIGQKIYAVSLKGSNWQPHLLEIDPVNNKVEVLEVQGRDLGITNLGNNGSANSLFGFSPVPNSDIMAEVRPVTFNIQDGTTTEISKVQRISALSFSHKTFYNKEAKEFAALVASDKKLYLFSYKPSTGAYQMLEVQKPENLFSLVSIVGVKKI
ncbi:hypothetical protein JRG66_09400 [Salinimicrobium tongyeongense]|uniref:TolB-like 6-blade propeller-like n=1 Tax=Salinimicrobium tongyeongense TaxID=2809707 RepID=A0ABY6NNT0_9FLAO|nr:hypothetical protein [Salinimicrobium tongyeongense]UZH54213.1 hypothetical protein JRG66_09400 [Salinimicrobium tongyeongense]